MSIRRACSYVAAFTLPDDAQNYLSILATISQRKEQKINKTKDELDLSGRVATLKLSQEETLTLEAGVPAQLQIRVYKSTYEAPGSKIFTVDVLPSLNEVILT